MGVPAQTPAWQVSPVVQALPSLQLVPLATGWGFGQVPVAGSQLPPVWHWSGAGHTMPVPLQTPAWQVSPVVKVLPSLQAVPLATGGFEQVPISGLQVPAVWHWSGAGQTTAVPWQTPPWQLSAVVQALPSLHAVPFGAGGFEHVPVAGLQVPASWHWSSTVQATGVPEHAPARQLSPVVQALPSLQLVPFATGWGFGQVPVAGSQLPPVWHWSGAGHTMPVPLQTPAWQVSPVVQVLPSLQAVPLATGGFEQVPISGLQVPAVWHWSGAGQTTAVPWQTPPWQLSAM